MCVGWWPCAGGRVVGDWLLTSGRGCCLMVGGAYGARHSERERVLAMGSYSVETRVCGDCRDVWRDNPDCVWRDLYQAPFADTPQARAMGAECGLCGGGFAGGCFVGVVVWVHDVLDGARDRGEARGMDDRDAGVWNDAPLSGEWAGESVRELLGDLIDALGDGFADDVCDAYEAGYALAFVDTDKASVCVDCAQVLANGVCDGWEDSPDDTRVRACGVFPYPIDSVAVLDVCATFAKYPCECCGSTLAGARVECLVWVARDADVSRG